MQRWGVRLHLQPTVQEDLHEEGRRQEGEGEVAAREADGKKALRMAINQLQIY